MNTHPYPKELKKVIEQLKKLPGVGTKTAERFSFDLLSWDQENLVKLGHSLAQLKNLQKCQECGALEDQGKCPFCTSTFRDKKSICVLSSPREVFFLESTKAFNGLYHVLDGLLSPMDGKDENSIGIEKLLSRIEKLNAKEIILAFESTLEGDATALYLKEILQKYPLSLSRLAMGIPMGSSLEFIDSGTLSRALTHRQLF